MAAARPAVVGGFVLGALALAVAGILFFGGAHLFQTTLRAVIYFDGSVAGLDVGAPVTFRGVRVGQVQRMSLQLSGQGESLIPVVIEVMPDRVTVSGGALRPGTEGIEHLVAAGLRAQLNLQSFVTAQLRVDLDFQPGTAADLIPGDTSGLPQIPALPSDLDRLRATLSEVPLQELTQAGLRALSSIDRVASRLSEDLGPLLDSSRRSLEGVGHTMATIEQVLTRLQTDMSSTLGHVEKLADSTRLQVDDRGRELGRLLQSADRVVRQADALVDSLNALASPRSAFRDSLEATARDLAASAGSLRGFTREIERDPSLILRGRSAR